MTKVNTAVQDVIADAKPPEAAKITEQARIRRLVEQAKRLPDVRADKVRQMRRLIALGRLETRERINVTAQRVLEELGPQH
jgi:hypothetical protein